MAGAIRTGVEAVDTTVFFTELTGYEAQCERCNATKTGSEMTIEGWAVDHVRSCTASAKAGKS